MTENALNGVERAGVGGGQKQGGCRGPGDAARQCAGGSGLRQTCPRSPRYRHSECCANDCVFMAVKLLQVLVLGVIAAATDGALFSVLCPSSHVLAREMFTAMDACAILVCLHRVKHRPNLQPTPIPMVQ